MRNGALLGSLVWIMGCGGGTSAPQSLVESDPELARMAVELRMEPRSRLLAAGHDQVIVPAAVFGTSTDIVAWFSFVAIRNGGGDVRGVYRVSESAEGTTSTYSGHLTCAGVYDFNGLSGNRAKVGGRVETSDDPGVPPGSFIWWQAIDNRSRTRPDQSTLAGFGDEAANSAFCGSANVPRFGPFDVGRGEIVVGPGEPED